MAQSSTAAATAKHNGFTLKFDEMNNNIKTSKNNSLTSSSPPPPPTLLLSSSSSSSSSPRRTAIGKPSLRLSIPTIEQITESSKSQPDPGNKKIDSFVKRMIDNCNHSGQLPSNVECTINGDSQSNSVNAAEICDTNRVKSVIEKLDKNKRMSNNGGDSNISSNNINNNNNNNNSVNGKSPTSEVVPVPVIYDDKERTIKLSIDDLPTLKLNDGNKVEQNNDHNHNHNNNNNEVIIPVDTNECSQHDNFPSYSTFENDFKRRINELSSSRSDTQTHGIAFHHFLPYLFLQRG